MRKTQQFKYEIDSDCYVWDEAGNKHRAFISDRSVSSGWPRYLVHVETGSGPFVVWKDEGNVDPR